MLFPSSQKKNEKKTDIHQQKTNYSINNILQAKT